MLPPLTWTANPSLGIDRSVEGRLRERAGYPGQRRKRAPENRLITKLMLAGDAIEDVSRQTGRGVYYSVGVFVFALPDSGPARQLRERKAYFDTRTGEKWDVFFPGYFQKNSLSDNQQDKFNDDWGFSDQAFDEFRRELESKTGGQWKYSGGSDLVLINIVVDNEGHVIIDYSSVISGTLTDPADNNRTLTLGEVIERISNDLESDAENPHYGVSEVIDANKSAVARSNILDLSALGQVTISSVGTILGAIGARILGLSGS